jgi:hypothetical protein
MKELLTPPAKRATTFRRGSHQYDGNDMGYTDEGPYVLDTSTAGSANTGHTYGTAFLDREKRDLIEYLKTL